MACTKLLTSTQSTTRLKLLNVWLACTVGTATVERSFSQMKEIKISLRNRISDINLAELMRIEVEGPEFRLVDFQQIVNIFKGTKSVNYIMDYKSHAMSTFS